VVLFAVALSRHEVAAFEIVLVDPREKVLKMHRFHYEGAFF